MIEFIRLATDEKKADIPEPKYSYESYIDSLKLLSLPAGYSDMKEQNVLMRTVENPKGNYDFDRSVNFNYTYICLIWPDRGHQETIYTEDPGGNPWASDPVLHIFHSAGVEYGNWYNDDYGNGHQARITFTPTYDGWYYLIVRAYNSYYPKLVNLIWNIPIAEAPAAGKLISCDVNKTGDLNFFTSSTSEDPSIFVQTQNASDRSGNGWIKGWNFDYSGSGDYNWGQNARVKKSFSQYIKWVIVASESYEWNGWCALTMACYNSDIVGIFPLLKADDAIRSANGDGTYNCISWSGGRAENWCSPPNPGNPWRQQTSGEEQAFDLQSFDNYYGNTNRYGQTLCRGRSTNAGVLNEAQNYTRSGATSTNAYVALWADYDDFTHGSVRYWNANYHWHGYDWESKCGGLERIFHPRDALGGYTGCGYGSIQYYYRWDGSWSYGTPPSLKTSSGEINRLAKIDQAEFSAGDNEKLNKFLTYIPDELKDSFNTKYETWKATWERPEIKIHSNPRRYARSEEYQEFISYCKLIGKKSWLMVFEKYRQGDELTINAIEDLTFKEFPGLMDSIVIAGNNRARANNLIPSQSANWTNYSLCILSKLQKADLYGANDQAEQFGLVPDQFELHQNYPNPFNLSTNIKFGLPEESYVTLKIYNILGQEVAVILNNQLKSSGWHTVSWNGMDKNSKPVSSGVYIYHLIAGDRTLTQKMIVMK